MKASERLLKLDKHLDVWKFADSDDVGVSYERCDVKEYGALIGAFGRGKDFEEACENYIDKISGKTLVFDADTDYRKEVTVL